MNKEIAEKIMNSIEEKIELECYYELAKDSYKKYLQTKDIDYLDEYYSWFKKYTEEYLLQLENIRSEE